MDNGSTSEPGIAALPATTVINKTSNSYSDVSSVINKRSDNLRSRINLVLWNTNCEIREGENNTSKTVLRNELILDKIERNQLRWFSHVME